MLGLQGFLASIESFWAVLLSGKRGAVLAMANLPKFKEIKPLNGKISSKAYKNKGKHYKDENKQPEKSL